MIIKTANGNDHTFNIVEVKCQPTGIMAISLAGEDNDTALLVMNVKDIQRITNAMISGDSGGILPSIEVYEEGEFKALEGRVKVIEDSLKHAGLL